MGQKIVEKDSNLHKFIQMQKKYLSKQKKVIHIYFYRKYKKIEVLHSVIPIVHTKTYVLWGLNAVLNKQVFCIDMIKKFFCQIISNYVLTCE